MRSRRTAVRVAAVAKRDEDSKGFVPRLGAAIGSACLAVSLLAAGPGYADLNRFEYELEGEFGKGSAQQFAQMDINGEDFSGKGKECRRARCVSVWSTIAARLSHALDSLLWQPGALVHACAQL